MSLFNLCDYLLFLVDVQMDYVEPMAMLASLLLRLKTLLLFDSKAISSLEFVLDFFIFEEYEFTLDFFIFEEYAESL